MRNGHFGIPSFLHALKTTKTFMWRNHKVVYLETLLPFQSSHWHPELLSSCADWCSEQLLELCKGQLNRLSPWPAITVGNFSRPCQDLKTAMFRDSHWSLLSRCNLPQIEVDWIGRWIGWQFNYQDKNGWKAPKKLKPTFAGHDISWRMQNF